MMSSRANYKNYKYDIDKEKRLNLGYCKYCYYIKRINDIKHVVIESSQTCLICGEEFANSSSIIDNVCGACVEDLERCRRCGNRLDD